MGDLESNPNQNMQLQIAAATWRIETKRGSAFYRTTLLLVVQIYMFVMPLRVSNIYWSRFVNFHVIIVRLSLVNERQKLTYLISISTLLFRRRTTPLCHYHQSR